MAVLTTRFLYRRSETRFVAETSGRRPALSRFSSDSISVASQTAEVAK